MCAGSSHGAQRVALLPSWLMARREINEIEKSSDVSSVDFCRPLGLSFVGQSSSSLRAVASFISRKPLRTSYVVPNSYVAS